MSSLSRILVGAISAAAIGSASAAPRSFDQPAQPLGAALAQFSRAAGVVVLVDPALVAGKRAPSLGTTAEPAEALSLLLAGSGLDAAPQGNGFVVRAASTEQAITVLPPVNVVGHMEQGWSQIEGYVAHRSQTATKTDTPILDTPQSIAVVTRDEMDQQNVQSLKQALRYTANTTPDTRANFGGFDVLYARGFTLDRYLDGLKLLGGANYTTPQIDPYELERVEVLLGSASTLYGQASPGGIVNMISKRPTSEPQGEVRLQLGNRDQKSIGFDVAGPANTDKTLLYRVTGTAFSGDTQIDQVQDRHGSLAPSLTWRPSRDTELTLLARFDDAPKAGYYNFVPSAGSVLPNPNGKIPTNFYSGDPDFQALKRKEWSLGYHFEHRFDETWVVRQNLRYMHTDGTTRQLLPFGLEDDQRTLDRYSLSDEGSIKAFNVDTQAEAKFVAGPTQHTVLVGLDYQNVTEDDQLGLDFGPSIDLFAPVYHQAVATPAPASDTQQKLKQLGIYVQDQIKYDAWSLLLGARQDHATASTLDRFSATSQDQDDNAFTGRVALLYHFDNDVAPYVSYTTSFQPVAGTDFNGNAFEPTRGRQVEAGVRYQPIDSNVLYTFAAFDLEQTNVPTADPDHVTFNVQTGKVRSRGLEASVKATVNKRLSMTASYTYLDSVVRQGTDTNQGKTPLYVPRNSASAWVNYDFGVGTFSGLGLGAGVRYVGSTWGDDADTLQVPANTLLDLVARYDLGVLGPALRGTTVALNVSNLFDRTYVSECTNDNCLYGLRRNVMATLTYRW